jgi:hypothetical protein
VHNEQEITARLLRELSQILPRADASTLLELEKLLKDFKKCLSGPRTSTTRSTSLNIFEIHKEQGPETLRSELMKLDDKGLRKLLSEHNFASSAETRKMNQTEMCNLLLEKLDARLQQGQAFR